MTWTDIAFSVGLIFVFVLIGGVFAAAEMALVTLRDSQIKQLTHRGSRGRAVARLTSDPNRFLSAVQIGVTVAGFLSAAFGAERLADPAAAWAISWGFPEAAANPTAIVVITVMIAYVSIVLGELSAKRLAMQRAEGFALALAPLVDAIATIARPVIWLLGVSTNLVVRAVGGDPDADREQVSGEELRAMLGTAPIGAEERQILDDVFEAGERSLREVMVPRTEVDFLAGDMPAHKAMRAVQGAPHSRYPVTNGSSDDIVGFLHVRDLMDLDSVARSMPVAQLARPVLSLPDSARVLRALAMMRDGSAHLAIVRDEYGGTAGIVTLEDLVEELIGDITDEYDVVEPDRPELSEVDGLTSLEDFADDTGLQLPEGPYDTVAGYVMARLSRLPHVGDHIECDLPAAHDPESVTNVALTVTELDGRRVARIGIRRT